jgi:hypothetical protein
MPDEDAEAWWEQYGIDPGEITASVEAALVGDAIARQCAQDVSDALLRTLAERTEGVKKVDDRMDEVRRRGVIDLP